MTYLVKSGNEAVECDSFEGAVYVGEEKFKNFKSFEVYQIFGHTLELVYKSPNI